MATDILSVLRQAGFKGNALRTAYGIAMRESGGRADAFNPNRSTGDQSYGLFQINMLGNLGPSRRKQYGLQSNEQLLDPLTNARVAYRLSKGGTDFGAWGIGKNAYRAGAGYDTIKKYVDQFPGGGSGQPVQAAQPAAGKDRSRYFADLIRRGEWSLSAPLSRTVSLTREFNRAYGNQPIPDSPGLKYPRLSGKVDVGESPMVAEAFKWLGTPYAWGGGGTGGPSEGSGRGKGTVGFDCIARGVPVETFGGPVPIELVRPGDLVLTRRGYRRVIKAWMVRANADVYRVVDLVGTGDHRVWTENRGWVPLSTVTASDILSTCRSQRSLSSRGYATTATRTLPGRLIASISSVLAGLCTGLFGSTTTGATFPLGMRFTTATATPSTTSSTILNWWRLVSTAGSAEARGATIATSASSAATVSYLAQVMLQGKSVARAVDRLNGGGTAWTWASLCARGAARLWSAATSGHRNTARIRAANPLTGAEYAGKSDVFDLTVEGEHEFYAGGVLVHNCSGFLQYLYSRQGKQIPRVTYDQWRSGVAVGRDELQPGDAVFFRMGKNGPEHVGVYAGNGRFIHAPKTGDVVKVSSLNDDYYVRNYVGARRW